MKHPLIRFTLAAVCALPFTTVLAQQAPPTTTPPTNQAQGQVPTAVLASKLIGKDVTNASGQNLGEVQDLAVDMRSKMVRYVMIDAQNRMFAYPMSALRWSADGSKVLINATEQQLERAPRIDREPRGNAAGDAAYWGQVGDYWRDMDRRKVAQAATPATPQTARDTQMVWASKLVGWNVQARDGSNSIGEVEDLVIDPRNGTVKFAAVDFNDKIGGNDAKLFDDQLHPLPLNALETREGGDDLVLNVDRSRLQAAQGFDDDRFDSRLNDSAFIDQAARYADGLTSGGAATGQR